MDYPKGIIIFLFAFIPLFSPAQFTNILLDDSIVGYNPCEPSICINFSDPDNVIGGAILDKVYVTTDDGENWTTTQLKSSYGVYGDPCLLSDHDGNIYYLHLSDTDRVGPLKKGWLDRIVCQRSEDQGMNWTNGGFMGFREDKDQDKEWAIADPQTGKLYCTWTEFDKYSSKKAKDKSRILFATSEDHGNSWSEPVILSQKEGNCLDDDETTEGAVPTVGPNGEIYTAWSFNDTIFFDKSMDGGKSWLEKDNVVAEQPGGWTFDVPGISRCNGLPVTVCDISEGPHRGTIYVNWTDQRNGKDDTDVWVSKSTDRGETWSKPLKVNKDNSHHHQFLTWLTIDQTTGYLYCVFYDRRNYDDNQTDVYLAFSVDGGESFWEVKISESPFLPSKELFFGDYTNIAAHAGRIWPIWTRMHDQKSSVWTAKIKQTDLILEEVPDLQDSGNEDK